MNRLRVFVSSAMRELEVERCLTGETIRSIGMEPLFFESDAGVLDPLTESLRLVQQAHITVLLAWQREAEVVRREYECARSLSQPILILEKQLRPDENRDSGLTTFLAGLKAAHTYKKFRLPTELRVTTVQGLQQIVADIAASSLVSLPNEDIYVQIRTALENATNVCMLSRSPIVLFGPRSYLTDNVLADERTGHRITTDLVTAAVAGRKRFTLIVSAPSVLAEVRGHSRHRELAKHVLDNLDRLVGLQKAGFRLRCTPGFPLPFQYLTYIVADETVIIWVKSPNTNHCIVSKNTGLAFAFRHMTEEYVQWDDTQVNTASLRQDLQHIVETP